MKIHFLLDDRIDSMLREYKIKVIVQPLRHGGTKKEYEANVPFIKNGIKRIIIILGS